MKFNTKLIVSIATIGTLACGGAAQAGHYVWKYQGIHSHWEYVIDAGDLSQLSTGTAAVVQGQPGGGLQTGALVVNNNYGGQVAVRLYHPQGGGRAFGVWNISPSTRDRLMMNNQQNVVIGSDWGIQLVFGNGVTSPIRSVGQIATSDGGGFHVDASRVFNGK